MFDEIRTTKLFTHGNYNIMFFDWIKIRWTGGPRHRTYFCPKTMVIFSFRPLIISKFSSDMFYKHLIYTSKFFCRILDPICTATTRPFYHRPNTSSLSPFILVKVFTNIPRCKNQLNIDRFIFLNFVKIFWNNSYSHISDWAETDPKSFWMIIFKTFRKTTIILFIYIVGFRLSQKFNSFFLWIRLFLCFVEIFLLAFH